MGGISDVVQRQHLQNYLPAEDWDQVEHIDTMEEVWNQLDKNDDNNIDWV